MDVFSGFFHTETVARRKAHLVSRDDRSTVYVVGRRVGDVYGYAITPPGVVAPWDTLLATYDEGEEVTT